MYVYKQILLLLSNIDLIPLNSIGTKKLEHLYLVHSIPFCASVKTFFSFWIEIQIWSLYYKFMGSFLQ